MGVLQPTHPVDSKVEVNIWVHCMRTPSSGLIMMVIHWGIGKKQQYSTCSWQNITIGSPWPLNNARFSGNALMASLGLQAGHCCRYRSARYITVSLFSLYTSIYYKINIYTVSICTTGSILTWNSSIDLDMSETCRMGLSEADADGQGLSTVGWLSEWNGLQWLFEAIGGGGIG